jgi:TolA-binding protein
MVVRLDRLENELRQANGRIEELENQQRLLQDQLKRFQQDVEYRLGGAAPPPAGAAPVASAPPAGSAPPVVAAAPGAAPAADLRPAPSRARSDAFDPNADPQRAGRAAPARLDAAERPADRRRAARHRRQARRRDARRAARRAGGTDRRRRRAGQCSRRADRHRRRDRLRRRAEAAVQRRGRRLSRRPIRPGGGAVQSLPRRQRHASPGARRDLLSRRDLLPAFAAARGGGAISQALHRLRKSSRAPEGLLRLGQSLAMLGSNDQACATFAEVGKRYPTAAPPIKKSAEREMQKDHC